MPARASAVELLAQLSGLLGKRRWYLFGGQAVNVHGRPRLTADVDVTVEVGRGEIARLMDELRAGGFELRVADPAGFVQATSVLPFVHTGTGMPLDVISPADLIVAKILAGRAKDLEDAAGVLRERRDEIDVDRVRKLLSQIEGALGQSDLTPAFERALRDSGRAVVDRRAGRPRRRGRPTTRRR